jgi:phosphoglycolate phosphatase
MPLLFPVWRIRSDSGLTFFLLPSSFFLLPSFFFLLSAFLLHSCFVRLIVFDLDGTLIDSKRDLADAINALLVELGADALPVDQVAEMIGDGAAVLVKRALTASGLSADTPDALNRFLGHYDDRLIAHTRPFDGIREVLDALRGSCPLAVLTNKPARATTIILEQLQLSAYFHQVVGGDSQFGRKPDPTGLLHLVHEAGSRPDATVLVGDSPIDLETARRANTHICLARYGFGFRFTDADFRGTERFVDRPADLPRVLASLRACAVDPS